MLRWLATAALVCGPLPALGSIFDTYGFGARGQAMGNALTADAQDFHAVYYNPAQLMERTEVHVGMGISYIEPRLGFARTRADSTFESVTPERNVGYHMGVSAPLGGVFDKKLAFGVGFFAPILRVTRAEFVDKHAPHFYMYENLPDKLLIAVAGAGQPFSWLKLGVGMQVLADLDGRADVSLSLVDQRMTRRRLSIDMHSDLAATAGVTITPTAGLNIAVSYRQDLDLRFRLPINAEIQEIGRLAFDLTGTSLYTPHQLNAGVSWRMPWIPMKLVFDMTWAMWSLAPSPAPDVTIAIDAGAIEDVADPDPIIDVHSTPVNLESVDIVIPRVGIEYTLGGFDLRAGYCFRPTPLPTPIFETNYADSDAHVATLGASWSFRDPTAFHKKPFTVALSFQATVMRARKVEKAEPDDPTGSYTLSGAVYSLGFDIQHDF